jgi:primosomal protein N''
MSEAIIVAIITGLISLVGTIITVVTTTNKTAQDMRIAQAVTDQKISDLTREVREHNEFARRVPVLESQMRDASQRIHDLEQRGA